MPERNRRRAVELRTLLIAPDVGLEGAAAEVQRVANALHGDILIDDVPITAVMDALSQATYDIVWFASHGGPDGVELSDGTLSAEMLTQLLRQACPGLVVLNTCSSLHIANQLHDDIGCAVIATIADVADRDAYVTGTLLASALARGLSIPDAYTAAKPGRNRTYVLLNGTVRMGGEDKLDDVQRLLLALSADLQRQLSEMRGEVGKLRDELGDLRGDVQSTNARIDSMGDRYAAPLTRTRAAGWLLAFALFLGGLGVWDSRDALHVPPIVAGLFAAFVLIVAAWLFVWGIGFRFNR